MVVKAEHNLIKLFSINHKADVHKRCSLRDHIHIAFLQRSECLLEHSVKTNDILSDHGYTDLLSRPVKSTGGYCMYLEDYCIPFIFMNGNGTFDANDKINNVYSLVWSWDFEKALAYARAFSYNHHPSITSSSIMVAKPKMMPMVAQ